MLEKINLGQLIEKIPIFHVVLTAGLFVVALVASKLIKRGTSKALSKKADPVLHQNLRHAEEAGVKLSSDEASQVQRLARRVWLEKTASSPCTCGGTGSCPACRVQRALRR